MHELGVTFYVIKDVKKIAEDNNVYKVDSVTLEIGQVSGVIHEQLQDCWKWAIKKEPIMDCAKLLIEEIPAVTFCENCKKTYATVPQGKICPHCGSDRTYLTQGNEFNIKEIEVLDQPHEVILSEE